METVSGVSRGRRCRQRPQRQSSVTEQIQIAQWKCAFLHEAHSSLSFTGLAGELMNSRSRYTAESRAIVWIIRKCASLPEGNSSKLNSNQKIPGQNCLGIALSFSFLSPCSVNNPTKARGFRTMELIAIFFVNAIACKKRVCSPHFSVSAWRLLCN